MHISKRTFNQILGQVVPTSSEAQRIWISVDLLSLQFLLLSLRSLFSLPGQSLSFFSLPLPLSSPPFFLCLPSSVFVSLLSCSFFVFSLCCVVWCVGCVVFGCGCCVVVCCLVVLEFRMNGVSSQVKSSGVCRRLTRQKNTSRTQTLSFLFVLRKRC